MKRDMDLVRAILLRLERLPPGCTYEGELPIEGYETKLVMEHVRIMVDGGLLKGRFDPLTVHDMLNEEYVPTAGIDGLTWQGHDLLESIRADSMWARVKAAAAEKGVGLTLDVTKALALEYAKRKLLGGGPV